MKKNIVTFCTLLIFLVTTPLFCAVMIQTFNTPISTKTFDPMTGNFYVGTEGDGDFSLARLDRNNLKFTAIAENPILNNSIIEFLTTSAALGAQANIVGVIQNTNQFSALQPFITNPTGKIVQRSKSLNDAASVTTSGITSIAASANNIFAAVRPSTKENFGGENSGIALLTITPKTLALTTHDATTGEAGNKAVQLDVTRTDLIGNNVTFQAGTNANQIAMHWDEPLQQLYVGLRLQENTNAESFYAVVTGSINNPNKALTLKKISEVLDPGENNIVLATIPDDTARITIKQVRTMHCSTGTSYLIVNGSNEFSDNVGNKIRALPLVDNPTSIEHGTLANKNEIISGGKFTQAATIALELADDTVDLFALVGDGDFLINPTRNISDMVVVGDTVYVAVSSPQEDPNNETSIWYSQALFDDLGRIDQWTPWAKRALPINTTIGTGGIKFFSVDAVNGTIIFVEAESSTIVGRTAWTLGQEDPNSLVARLRKLLQEGSYAVLDLHRRTKGFFDTTTTPAINNTTYRYALLGGVNKVVFCLTSQTMDNTSTVEIAQDYSQPGTILSTEVPNAGPIRVLEYSRLADPTFAVNNFFFAGSDAGLFIFADANGNGFAVNQLFDLAAAPFTTNTWQKVNITGAVADIKSLGNSLYVLTYEVSTTQGIKSKLYRIPFVFPFTTMFDNKQLIAETGVGPFTKTVVFFATGLLSTNDDSSQEQIILATNQGLYSSSPMGGSLPPDITWQLVNPGDTTMYPYIQSLDTPVPTMVWPVSVQDDEQQLKTYQRASAHQVATFGTNASAFVPTNFNPLGVNKNTKTFDPTTYFWSDGGRRITIISHPDGPSTKNSLTAIPFNTKEWNGTPPIVLTNKALQSAERFYWIRQLGATGSLMVGTNNGVISLE